MPVAENHGSQWQQHSHTSLERMDFVRFMKVVGEQKQLPDFNLRLLEHRLADMYRDAYGVSRFGTGPDADERRRHAKAERLKNPPGYITQERHGPATIQRLGALEDLMETYASAMLAVQNSAHQEQLQSAIRSYVTRAQEEHTGIVRREIDPAPACSSVTVEAPSAKAQDLAAATAQRRPDYHGDVGARRSQLISPVDRVPELTEPERD